MHCYLRPEVRSLAFDKSGWSYSISVPLLKDWDINDSWPWPAGKKFFDHRSIRRQIVKGPHSFGSFLLDCPGIQKRAHALINNFPPSSIRYPSRGKEERNIRAAQMLFEWRALSSSSVPSSPDWNAKDALTWLHAYFALTPKDTDWAQKLKQGSMSTLFISSGSN